MESSYKTADLRAGCEVKTLGPLAYTWREMRPVRGLIILSSFYLVVSLAYVVYFTRTFNFGARVIVLHMSVVSGVIVVTMLTLGLALRLRPIREWRFTAPAMSLLLATGYSLIVLLYFANYVSNSFWGNNVTYELVVQYIFKGGLFQKELRMLPTRYYILLAAGAVAIFSVHLVLSRHLFRSLEALFSPGGKLSLFRSRRRSLASGAAILLTLLLIGVTGFLSTRVSFPYRSRVLFREPIIGLFLNPDGFVDVVRIRTDIIEQEHRIRASYPSGQAFEKKNVVIILVDALRADHMQAYGYDRPTTPFLAGLLKTGHLKKVDFATAVCADTNCGVLGILSSHTFEKQATENFKIQDLLHDVGYQTYFIVSSNHNWYKLKECYGKEMTYFFDGTSSARYQWSDDRVVLEGIENVADFTGTPAFFYFHLVSTHSVGVRQEEYVKYRPAKSWAEFESTDREYNAESVINDYDNSVTQADGMIEKIFGSLKQKGYLDNSIVVILADHGEGLGPLDHSIYGHVSYLYQECLRIPLLIYDDDDRVKYANLSYASQIDVAPTIVDRLGLKIPSSWQGQSLLSPNAREYSFHQTGTSRPNYAVIYRTDRAIYKYLRHRGWAEELYELVSDPGEKRNLMESADPALIDHMREKLAEHLSDN